MPRTGEFLSAWLGKSSRQSVNYCLDCASVSTTALFWVELDLCGCFIQQHTLLQRPSARQEDRSCSNADSGAPMRRAEQRDAHVQRLWSARMLAESSVAMALQV